MIFHMDWSHSFAHNVAAYCVQKRYISRKGDFLELTGLGRELAKQYLTLS